MSHVILRGILKQAGIEPSSLKHIKITGQDPILPSPFLIGEAGAAALAAIGYMAAELWRCKTGVLQNVEISVRDAAIAQRSHQYLRVVDDITKDLWSPLSGFYTTSDQRIIQFHCNFPHHQQGVVDFLGSKANKEAVAAATKKYPAEYLENKLNQHGLCAAIVRSKDEWSQHPQASAIAKLPLFEIIKISDSKPEALHDGNYPLSKIRVLDLTRVLAGPVCGKSLAEHGANVMRIASPNLPFILPLVMDTGFGKYAAHLDLDLESDKNKLFSLIASADAFLQAYRPGALADRGFSAQELAKIRPGIICVDLSAYSHKGVWADRHGYDSLVQSATGIAAEQSESQSIQHLPAQSLDYITGYLATFAIMEALRRRSIDGGSYLIRLSLAQTAHWFNNLGRVTANFKSHHTPSATEIQDLLTKTHTQFGVLEHLAPVLKMSETPPKVGRGSVPLGYDPAEWVS